MHLLAMVCEVCLCMMRGMSDPSLLASHDKWKEEGILTLEMY
jgi:hypothetical protein